MADKHVVVYPSDLTGSGCYRLAWPGKAAAAAGKPVTVMPRPPQISVDNDNKVKRINVGNAKVVVFQRPASVQLTQVIPMLQENGVKVILDLDDTLSAIHPRNVTFKVYDPRVSHKINWMHAARNCELADLVTVATPALAEEYGSHGRVAVIPNHIPESYLKIPRVVNEIPVVGWAGWTSTHVDDLIVTRGMINQVLVDTGAKFAAFGDPKIFTDLSVRPQPRHENWGFVNINDYPRKLVGFDIGLVPLAKNKFNAAKCLEVGTKVSTGRGILPIGEITDTDCVWYEGKWVDVIAVEHQIPQPGLQLTTKDGYLLRLTPNHRLLLGEEWVPASQLKIGDMVKMGSDGTGVTKYVSVPWPADGRKSKYGFNQDRYLTSEDSPTISITPRWGRLLGAFVGDGSVGQSTSISFSCDGQDQDWIELLISDIEAIGLSAGTEKITTYDGKLLRRRSVRTSSAHLLRVLHQLGLTTLRENGKPLRKVCVPEVIWNSPLDVIAQFLAGYFETDGHCAGSGIGATSKEEQLIKDVQRLLLLFGIESRVFSSVHKNQTGFSAEYWRINLRRAAADIFAEKIGFCSARKREKLSEITTRPHSNAYQPMKWEQELSDISPCFISTVDIQVEGEVFMAAGFVSHNSWLKSLEYASLGIVPVVTPTDENMRMVELGVALRAEKPREWYDQVKLLIEDSDMRQELSDKGRKVASDWVIEKNWALWYNTWISD